MIEIFKAQRRVRLEPYGSTLCRRMTVVVLCVCDSVVHQCRVSEAVGGGMIHSSINNGSAGQACICCQEQGESLSLCVQLYHRAAPPGAINLAKILVQSSGNEATAGNPHVLMSNTPLKTSTPLKNKTCLWWMYIAFLGTSCHSTLYFLFCDGYMIL